MVLTLYMQSFSGPVRSVLLTAEALGLTLQKKVLDLSKQEHLKPDYLKINPQHTIPTLDDSGTVIWDSHAINAYLVGKYGRDDSLYPKDLAKRAVVDQRLHFDSGVIFSWLRNIARGAKYRGLKALTEEQIEGVVDGYTHLENFLKDRDWVAGDALTIADLCLIANVTSLDIVLPVNGAQFPNVSRWIGQAQRLPYYHVNVEGLAALRATLKALLS